MSHIWTAAAEKEERLCAQKQQATIDALVEALTTIADMDQYNGDWLPTAVIVAEKALSSIKPTLHNKTTPEGAKEAIDG